MTTIPGGYKRVGLALIVEIMATAMTGAASDIHVSPFSVTRVGPPRTGQFLLAIAPDVTSGGQFAEHLAALVEGMREQPGVRVPGDGRRAARRRAERNGVAVNPATLENVKAVL